MLEVEKVFDRLEDTLTSEAGKDFVAIYRTFDANAFEMNEEADGHMKAAKSIMKQLRRIAADVPQQDRQLIDDTVNQHIPSWPHGRRWVWE